MRFEETIQHKINSKVEENLGTIRNAVDKMKSGETLKVAVAVDIENNGVYDIQGKFQMTRQNKMEDKIKKFTIDPNQMDLFDPSDEE